MAQSTSLRISSAKTSPAPATESILAADSALPRVAMVCIQGDDMPGQRGGDDHGDRMDYARELSRKLALLGYQVDIWTRRVAPQPELEVVTNRVRIIRVPGGIASNATGDEWSERALQFIAKHQLRYVFVDSHHGDSGVATRALCQTLQVPHVHTPHSILSEDDADGQAENERRVCADCDVVIATTPPELERIVRDYEVPTAKVRLVPRGYDDHRFFPVSDADRAAIRQRIGFKGKVILALGRLARSKGYDLLIDSFALVAQRDPRATLHLAVGAAARNPAEEELLQELKAQAAQRGLAGRVRFGPLVSGGELADYYRGADQFVLCSRDEPVGMTAIEAMACGTPTVLTVHSGLHRVLSFGRHALFADPLDREDLGIMMAKILKLPRLRDRLSRMGAHKARSFFTWTGIAHQVVAAVEERVTADAVTVPDGESESWLATE